MKEDYIMSPDWDVVATQSMVHDEPTISEVEESKMRSKAMLIIAHNGGGSKVWKRVMKRFMSCIRGKVIKIGE